MKDRRATNGILRTRITLEAFVLSEAFQRGLQEHTLGFDLQDHYAHPKAQMLYERGRQLSAYLKARDVSYRKYFSGKNGNKISAINKSELIKALEDCGFRSF
jgi:hypothetical protein